MGRFGHFQSAASENAPHPATAARSFTVTNPCCDPDGASDNNNPMGATSLPGESIIARHKRHSRFLQFDPEEAADQIDTRVRTEQAHLFWSASFLLLGLGAAVAVALTIAQWPVIEFAAILLWLGILAVVSAVWAIWAYLYRRSRPGGAATERWIRIASALALAYGIAWGAASLLLFPAEVFAHQAILTVMLAGLSAGAITMLSSLPLTGIAFLIPALLPLCYRFALTGSQNALLILAIVLVLILALILSNRHLYTTLRDNLRLRIEKAVSEAALHESEARYRLLFDQSPLGLVHYNADGAIRNCNRAFIDILGSSRDQIEGTSMIDDVSDERMAQAVRDSLDKGWGYYEALYDPLAGINRVMLRAFFNRIAGPDDETLGGVAIVEDFTQRKEAEEALNRQAFYDLLTGLPNRRLLRDRLDKALTQARREAHVGVLLFLDVDYFKRINDWLGHGEGDDVLRAVADRMNAAMRETDTLARLSGDEFILLAPNAGSSKAAAIQSTTRLTERIQTALQQPLTAGGRELRLTASIGATLFPRRGDTPERLLRKADTAMYMAKREVRGEVRFHHESMDTHEAERLGLESELSDAISKDELNFQFQPVVDSDGRAVGAELLLRWQHPWEGEISPERFIPIAEASGLIATIGRWVIDNLCARLAKMEPTQRAKLGRVALNISAREFHHPNFAQYLEGRLDHYRLDGRLITIEVTENVLIENFATTIERMERLRSRGIRFAVDDFGTGYSSLTYLKRLPVDSIKIDHSFIADVVTRPESAAIVDALLAMASRLELDVVAEGVETAEQLDFLAQRQCQYYQGFYWARPMPFDQLLDYVAGTPAAESVVNNPGARETVNRDTQ